MLEFDGHRLLLFDSWRVRSTSPSLVGCGGFLADAISCHDVDAVMSGRFLMIWCPDAGFLFYAASSFRGRVSTLLNMLISQAVPSIGGHSKRTTKVSIKGCIYL